MCQVYFWFYYTLLYTLSKFVFSKVLNNRLFSFNFAPESNIPYTFTLENIRQSASEMLVLIRYFGLVIGDFVPVGEPLWALFITMGRVIDIMLSESLEIAIFYLKLVRELN